MSLAVTVHVLFDCVILPGVKQREISRFVQQRKNTKTGASTYLNKPIDIAQGFVFVARINRDDRHALVAVDMLVLVYVCLAFARALPLIWSLPRRVQSDKDRRATKLRHGFGPNSKKTSRLLLFPISLSYANTRRLYAGAVCSNVSFHVLCVSVFFC